MVWFRVDDGWHKHRKRIRAGLDLEGMAAQGLWVAAGSWAGDELTDGFIPDDVVDYLAPGAGQALAKRLESARLWVRAERDGESGWQFHEWVEQQPTAEEVRAVAARKSSGGRLGNHRRWHVNGKTDPSCPFCAGGSGQGGAASHHPEPPSDRSSDRSTDRTSDQSSESGANPPTRPDPTRPDELQKPPAADAADRSRSGYADLDKQDRRHDASNAGQASDEGRDLFGDRLATEESQKRPRKASARVEIDDQDPRWRALWASYPRKKSRDGARRALGNALARADFDLIQQRLAEYVAYEKRKGTELAFYPYLATWLNGSRWNDDLEAEEPAGAPRRTPASADPYRNPTDSAAYDSWMAPAS